MIVDTCFPILSMSTLKYFLIDAAKHKPIVHQLDLIEKNSIQFQKLSFLWSWTVDLENTSQSIPTILENNWG